MSRTVGLASRQSPCEQFDTAHKTIGVTCSFQLYRFWVLGGPLRWVILLPLFLLMGSAGQLTLISQGRSISISDFYRHAVLQPMGRLPPRYISSAELPAIAASEIPVFRSSALCVVERAAGNIAGWATPMVRLQISPSLWEDQ